MTAKEYLSQAYVIERRIGIIRRKVQALRSALEYKSPNLQGSSGGAAGDRMSESVAKIIEYEQRAESLVGILIDRRMEIEESINALADPVQREILERRYLLYEPWEGHFDENTGEYIKGIADSMEYTPRRIYQIHGEALKNISVNFSEFQF
ncbi:MAG: hypothetical protein IJM75_06245 [Ruminococcus sp.]|nr:hypothetical protein [Ruminococcus sp.]